MTEALEHSALQRWQLEPLSFINQVLCDPETGRPFELLPAQRKFFNRAFKFNQDGRLRYPEQVFACPKKSGKTATAALHLLTTTLVYGGRFAEGYCVANDLEQSVGRVFEACRRICEVSPYLRRECEITARSIRFPATGASIQAIASDYAGAAGSNPTISSFDELWGYVSENSRRLWDEMCVVPTRRVSCRLVTTYAGFSGESELLQELYNRGISQRLVGQDLYAGDGLLMFWSHQPIAPWQDRQWLRQMRSSLRPNQYLRMIENRFVSSDSTFVDMDWYDNCVDPDARPIIADKSISVWVGVDASVKRDSTAIVAVTWDDKHKRVRVIWHRIFVPRKGDPIDFEQQVEETILDLRQRFLVRRVHYDPYQMASSAQRLRRLGVSMFEYPQSVPNLTRASQNLYELIKSGGIVLYPDDDIRLAVQRSVAVESTRGWRIAKEKSAHKIDVVVALGMAAIGAVRWGQREELSPVGCPVTFDEDGKLVTQRDPTAALAVGWVSTSGSRSPITDEVRHGGRVHWGNRLSDW
jgi:phage terminase large subunit-like protein